ncbi:MAG TPA: HdeD family acid-resistance protein [Mycobacterium sp.]|nr:HdeD family acid-resistance protein [Mycobacterium sp.]
MSAEPARVLGDVWKSMLAWGLITIIVGVLVLVWPGISITVASVLFGVYLLLSGIAEVALAFTLDTSGGARVLLFITGALSIVLGVLAFRHFSQGSAVLLLAIWIGVAFIYYGVTEIAIAFSYSLLPGRGSYVFVGILSVIAGVVVLLWPFDSIRMLALVVGIWLVLIGLSQVVSAFRARSVGQHIEHGVQRVTGSVS